MLPGFSTFYEATVSTDMQTNRTELSVLEIDPYA